MINVRLQTSPLSYQALRQSGRDVSGGSSALTRISKAPLQSLNLCLSQGPDKRRAGNPRVPAELDTQLVEGAIYQSDSSLQLLLLRLKQIQRQCEA